MLSQEFIDALAKWSDQTFGVERPPDAPLKHLRKEVEELIENPIDDEEYADCFMLLLDAWRKHKGLTGAAQGIIHAAWKKLDVCKNREW